MTSTPQQPQDLVAQFGLNELPPEVREKMLAEMSSTVIESAMLTFTLTLNDEEQVAFDTFLNQAPDGLALVEALMQQYPAFTDILQEEMVAFREEAEKASDHTTDPGF